MANGGQEYSTNLGLDILPISTDKDNLPDINRLYNAVKSVARNLDTYTGVLPIPQDDRHAVGLSTLRLQNSCKLMVKTTADIRAGMIVTVEWTGTEFTCHPRTPPETYLFGDVFVLESTVSGEYAEVYLKGLNSACSGLAVGSNPTIYDTDPGVIRTTAPASFTHSTTLSAIILASHAAWLI